MNEVYEFIKKCGTYYLATVDSDGQPRVRPFGTITVFEGRLYIQTGKKKEVSKQIQNNPKVEICCFKGNQWLRVAGELVRDDRLEPKEDMLDHFPYLKTMYAADDGNIEVLYFKNAKATFSSIDTTPRTIEF